MVNLNHPEPNAKRPSREDIPRILAELARAHPEVRFWLGDPLGIDDAMVEVLSRRISSAGLLDSRSSDGEEGDPTVPSSQRLADKRGGDS